MSEMSEPPEAVLSAYKALGLQGDEDFDAVKAAFRRLIKAAHPDTTSKDPATLRKLQILLKAYEILQAYAPRSIELILTPDEARKGGLRTVTVEDRAAMVRITPFARSGMTFTPIGETRWRMKVLVREPIVDAGQEEGPAERARREKIARERAALEARKADEEAGLLKTFLNAFTRSPPARLAKRLRKGAA